MKTIPLKKVTATMPSVGSYKLSYRTLRDLKAKVCKKFDIEPNLTRLIFTDKDKVTVDYLWSRQMILFGKAQNKLRKATVLIVGAGALGTELAKNTALLGFGNIKLVDFDVIEFSNLSRGMFTKADLGKKKAVVLAKKIRLLFPYVNVRPIVKKVEQCTATELKCDVILCGVDNVITRFWLTDFALDQKIPLVDGGLQGLKGRVQVVLPNEGPCLACNIPVGKYGEVAGLKNPCEDAEDAKIASFSTIASLVAAVQATEAMKIVLNMKPLRGVLIVDASSNAYNILELHKNKNCFLCSSKPKPKSINAKKYGIVFEELQEEGI